MNIKHQQQVNIIFFYKINFIFPSKAVETQQVTSTDANQISSSTVQQTQMPTPHFVPSGLNNNQQTKTNMYSPPSTTSPGMPSLPNTTAPRFPPATTPNS